MYDDDNDNVIGVQWCQSCDGSTPKEAFFRPRLTQTHLQESVCQTEGRSFQRWGRAFWLEKAAEQRISWCNNCTHTTHLCRVNVMLLTCVCVCVFSTRVCGMLWRVKTHLPCSTSYPERQRQVEDRQIDEWMPSVSSTWCRWTWPLLPIMPHCWRCWWRPEQNTTPTVSDTHTLQSHYTINHNMNLNNYVLWINVITIIFIDNFVLNHNHIFRIHPPKKLIWEKIQCHTIAQISYYC